MNEAEVHQILSRKKELRKQIRFLRNGLDKEKLLQTAFLAGDWFKDHLDQYGIPKAVFSYADINKEVPTTMIHHQALKNNIPLFLPKVLGERNMCFVLVSDLNELVSGAYGIMEPEITEHSLVVCADDCKKLLPVGCQCIFVQEMEQILMLVPGLAFDNENYRLGYGGGYYDTYLKKMSEIGKAHCSVALAYDFQMVAEVPREEHDAKVDQIKIFPVM